ncbi:MAG: HAD-IA family hydrolase [Limnohabitans sp.]|nr:HAD-IA family hydrolase [Limnohabitans sp.]
MLQALIFDVDGTLADTEMAHLAAFNHAFAEMGLGWRWDVLLYNRLLAVSGGKERIKAYWQTLDSQPKDISGAGMQETIDRLHEIKTAAYEQAVQDGAVQMRPGVLALLSAASAAGLKLAIATTTSPVNIAALLRQTIGPDWKQHFSVIEDASTAPRKKPDPMVYQQTLARLGLAPEHCLAFEDSENGLRAALAAGLSTVITPNDFTAEHDFKGALRILPSLHGVGLAQLREWHHNAFKVPA